MTGHCRSIGTSAPSVAIYAYGVHDAMKSQIAFLQRSPLIQMIMYLGKIGKDILAFEGWPRTKLSSAGQTVAQIFESAAWDLRISGDRPGLLPQKRLLTSGNVM